MEMLYFKLLRSLASFHDVKNWKAAGYTKMRWTHSRKTAWLRPATHINLSYTNYLRVKFRAPAKQSRQLVTPRHLGVHCALNPGATISYITEHQLPEIRSGVYKSTYDVCQFSPHVNYCNLKLIISLGTNNAGQNIAVRPTNQLTILWLVLSSMC